MNFDKNKIEKKIKQKQIRLSEQNNKYLTNFSERFKMSEADVINVMLDSLGKEINFIEQCEEAILKLKQENEKTVLRRNLKIISIPNFIGYYPLDNKNFFAYENIEIFLEDSFDKNFEYFITFQKKIDILETPNSSPIQSHFFYESKYVNDLYNEFKTQGLNINTLIIDKNYNEFINPRR